MYVPPHFRDDDVSRAHQLIRSTPFALLLTPRPDEVQLSWIPFELDATRGPLGTLEAHLARANPHADAVLAGAPSTVAFLGPHGYVSPRWYVDPARQVPTWSFVAVHAHGVPRPLEDPQATLELIGRLTARHEAGRPAPWSIEEARAHAERLVNGVVAFTLPIDRLEHKRKLSQNRSAEDRRRVMEALSGQDGSEALLGAMRQLYREDGTSR